MIPSNVIRYWKNGLVGAAFLGVTSWTAVTEHDRFFNDFEAVDYSALLEQAESGNIASLNIIDANTLTATTQDGQKLKSTAPPGENFIDRFHDNVPNISAEDHPPYDNPYLKLLLLAATSIAAWRYIYFPIKYRSKMSKEGREMQRVNTAYHEAGHALLAYLFPKTHQVEKISILKEPGTLGHVRVNPFAERNKEYMENDIMISLGGYIAEIMKSGENGLADGSSGDITMITNTARRMVCEYGMSPLGPINYSPNHFFNLRLSWLSLNGTLPNRIELSEAKKQEIEEHVQTIVQSCLERAVALLEENKDKLELLAQELLKKEVLSGKQGAELLGFDHGPAEAPEHAF